MEVSYSGQVIANRFEVSASIGEGACGTVWMAHDRVLGIHVAVKVLRDAMRRDPKRLAAFEREALVCLRMLSPNIVRVLAFGAEADEQPSEAIGAVGPTSESSRPTWPCVICASSACLSRT